MAAGPSFKSVHFEVFGKVRGEVGELKLECLKLARQASSYKPTYEYHRDTESRSQATQFSGPV